MRLCRASSMLHEQHLQQLLSCCPQLAVTTQTPPTTRPRCRGMHLMRSAQPGMRVAGGEAASREVASPLLCRCCSHALCACAVAVPMIPKCCVLIV